LPRARATLTADHLQRGERPTYWPAVFSQTGSTLAVHPLAWQGSGDLRTLTGANCLAHFTAGDRLFAAGEEIDILRLDESD
jgi:molybdopterin molybdotransferase